MILSPPSTDDATVLNTWKLGDLELLVVMVSLTMVVYYRYRRDRDSIFNVGFE